MWTHLLPRIFDFTENFHESEPNQIKQSAVSKRVQPAQKLNGIRNQYPDHQRVRHREVDSPSIVWKRHREVGLSMQYSVHQKEVETNLPSIQNRVVRTTKKNCIYILLSWIGAQSWGPTVKIEFLIEGQVRHLIEGRICSIWFIKKVEANAQYSEPHCNVSWSTQYSVHQKVESASLKPSMSKIALKASVIKKSW